VAKVYVKDVTPNEKIDSLFKVGKKALPTGKSGKPYLTITLFDKTGELDARIWENAAELDKAFEVGDLVHVVGATVVHQGHPQLKIDTLVKGELGELTAEDFAEPPPREEPAKEAAAPAPAGQGGGANERRFSELVLAIERVSDPHVRALLRSFVDDPELAPLIKRAPAAKTIHHAYPGGLLEHTLSCMRLALRLCEQYPQADRDLVVAGAFLHDVMKVKELSFDRGTDYTDEGRLVGHLVMTAQQIHERAAKIDGFPKLLEYHLTHLVLAHHGQLEYGSPKLPATLEALLVHALDELDSRVNSWLGIMQKDPGTESWTEFNKLYERHLWKGPVPTAAGKRPVESRGGGKRRQKVTPAGLETAQHPEAPRHERPERPPRREREDRPPRPPREDRPTREARSPREDRPPREARPPREPKEGPKLTFKPFAAIVPAEEKPAEEKAPEAAPQAAPEAAPVVEESKPTEGAS
jgi:3'-5' exoribonuclease